VFFNGQQPSVPRQNPGICQKYDFTHLILDQSIEKIIQIDESFIVRYRSLIIWFNFQRTKSRKCSLYIYKTMSEAKVDAAALTAVSLKKVEAPPTRPLPSAEEIAAATSREADGKVIVRIETGMTGNG
jgi:hypothetical protein